MAKIMIFIFAVFLLVIQTTSAQPPNTELSCQYQETRLSEEAFSFLYSEEGNKYDTPISLQDFKQGFSNESTCQCLTSFDIVSSIDKDIRVNINYELSLFSENKENVTVIERKKIHNLRKSSSKPNTNYDGGKICRGSCEISQNSIKYEFLETENTQGKWEKVEERVCQECNGHTCFNDGDTCSAAIDCGGRYCVENYCSSMKGVCYNGDCRCDSDEVQCYNEDRCVKVEQIANGNSPSCRKEECISQYIDNSTGHCQKSPEQLTEEFLKTGKSISILFALVVMSLTLGWFFFWKGKLTKKLLNEEEQKRIANRIEELKEDLKKKEHDMELGEKKRIKKAQQKNKKGLEDLEKGKKSVKKASEDLEKEKEKFKGIRLTPFSNIFNYKVTINEDGYEVFANSGKEFHRWWFKHKHNRKIKSGYEIHHKNFNKRDNRIENLVELTHEKHMELHHNRYNK
jgi:hypothetical protein